MASIPGKPEDEFIVCERAKLMLVHEKLQKQYAMACRLGAKVVVDPDLWDGMQAESEARLNAAQEAGRIVSNCIGCDWRGRQAADTAHCPPETVHRVEEWIRAVKRI